MPKASLVLRILAPGVFFVASTVPWLGYKKKYAFPRIPLKFPKRRPNTFSALVPEGNSTAAIPANFGNETLNYSIFSGRSGLRDLPLEWRERLGEKLAPPTTTNTNTNQTNSAKAIQALDLLAAGYLDAAHDVLLGVTFQELEAAEYAATHPGQTTWNQDHPLDETDDFLHSMIHRLEGAQRGEGGYTGHANAKYWFAGGPKASSSLTTTKDHPVYRALSDYANQNHPNLMRPEQTLPQQPSSPSTSLVLPTLIPTTEVSHEIAAGGGRNRTVHVPAGSWDGIALVDLWHHVSSSNPADISLKRQLFDLHCAEIRLWRQYVQQQ